MFEKRFALACHYFPKRGSSGTEGTQLPARARRVWAQPGTATASPDRSATETQPSDASLEQTAEQKGNREKKYCG